MSERLRSGGAENAIAPVADIHDGLLSVIVPEPPAHQCGAEGGFSAVINDIDGEALERDRFPAGGTEHFIAGRGCLRHRQRTAALAIAVAACTLGNRIAGQSCGAGAGACGQAVQERAARQVARHDPVPKAIMKPLSQTGSQDATTLILSWTPGCTILRCLLRAHFCVAQWHVIIGGPAKNHKPKNSPCFQSLTP